MRTTRSILTDTSKKMMIDTFGKDKYNDSNNGLGGLLMRDYSMYEKTPVMFSGAEKKFEIIIDGHRYILKVYNPL